MSEEKHLFYGHEIIRDREQNYVNQLLAQFKGRKVTEELQKEIWNLLQQEKYKGALTIPFKMAMRRDPSGIHPDYIEVILDTKV